MAIQFARIEYGSRGKGSNACRKAAYNARESIKCERTGELFFFKHKADNVFHLILLPEGVDGKFKDSNTLWNAAENAEKRKDSQVYKECVIALPDDRIITDEDRMEIAQRFANRVFVSKGLACQIDIHSPHEGEKNWHAHFIVTTRRFSEDGKEFSPYKARDTDPDIRNGKVIEADAVGEIYAEIQSAFFKEKGYDLRVDPIAIIPQEHLGPVRMRQHMSSALERAEMLRIANEAAVRNPELVLKELTEKQGAFTEKELDHFLIKHVDENEIRIIKEAILKDKNTIALYDPHTLEKTPYYTTTKVRGEEEKLLRFSEAVNERGGTPIKEKAVQRIIQSRNLSEEQTRALLHVTTTMDGLSIIEGRAGVGKSHVMGAMRDAYQDRGYRVVGLAPTNAVATDMTMDGFREAHTVHSMLFRNKNDRFSLNHNTILLLDEAAMLGNSAYVELFHAAKTHRCKVILMGDDRQISSIERGGGFSLLAEKFGSSELTQVRRQNIPWQKEVSEALGQGKVAQAVTVLSQNKALCWSEAKAEAMTALVRAWEQTQVLLKSKLILATRNADVDALNLAIREIRLQRGEIEAKGYECSTQRGREIFSIGDRICFTQTDKTLGIVNGAFGYIKSLSQMQCQVELDEGKEVQFNPQVYHGLKLGYAATVYKSQGKTLDHIYVLHDSAANSRTNYVALSRQTESLQVFVNREETRSEHHLIHQMSRDNNKTLSLRYLTEEQANRAKTLGDGYWDAAKELWINLKTNVRNKLTDLFHENKEFYGFKGREESKGKQQVVEVDSSATIWKSLFPIPENVLKPDVEEDPYLSSMTKDRQITTMHEYKDRKGNLLGYVVRLEDQQGNKITPTLTYCENEKGQQQWRWQDFGENRPLYGQEKLVRHATQPVLVVEGEKTADATQKLFPNHVVVSWPGGAEVVEKANWGPLLGRNVTIWPDQTQAGLKAAQHIEGKLKDINNSYRFKVDIKIVDLPKDLPVKWELRDALPQNLSLRDLHNLVHKEQGSQRIPIQSAQQANDLKVYKYLEHNHHKAIKEKPAHEVEAMKFLERYHAYQLDSYKKQMTSEQKSEFEKEVTSFMKNEKAINYLKIIDSDMAKSAEKMNKEIEKNLSRTRGFEISR